MTKAASNAMKTALAAEGTFLCRIWTITLRDSTVYRFTDANQNIVYAGNTYLADPGVTISAVSQSLTGSSQNAEINIAFTSTGIKEVDVRAGRLDNATFTLKVIDWKTATNGEIVLMQGSLSDVTYTDKNACSIQVRGLLSSRNPNNIMNEVYSKTCRAQLGDSRCTKDLTSLTITGTVAAIDGTNPGTAFTSAAVVGVQSDGFYSLGTITWTSGQNIGRVDEVLINYIATGYVAINFTPPYAIAPGDGFTMKPGCDKKATTCKNKFNNLLNFRGEVYAPAPDSNNLSDVASGNTAPVTIVGGEIFPR